MSQTKISLVIDNPSDFPAFEGAFPTVLDAAAAIPGRLRLESGKVFPKEDRSPTPAHRTLDLHFAGYDSASRAVEAPESGAFFGGLAGTGVSFIALFSDVERS